MHMTDVICSNVYFYDVNITDYIIRVCHPKRKHNEERGGR